VRAAADPAVPILPGSEVPGQTATLTGNRRVKIRVATAADLPGIVDFFERLSAESRYFRFFSPQPRMRRTLVERIVAPGTDRLTMLAVSAEAKARGRRVVAVGGWVYLPRERRCEISAAVADDWQNMLLGTYLVLVLLQAAVARGHSRFCAEVLGGNARMLGLLRDLGAPLTSRVESGVVRLDFELPIGT
jgi:GNAT superfamily N-acetyltransferase